MAFDSKGLESYNDVATRMQEFFAKHPDGCLQPADPAEPFRVQTIGDKAFVVYAAAAYRAPDDLRPGIGIAWEPFPGRTPYTRDSEVMNAETSAWGRAILAVGAADTRRGVASQEEVRNRRADQDEWENASPPRTDQSGRPTPEQTGTTEEFLARIKAAASQEEIQKIGSQVKAAGITPMQYDRLTRAASGRLAQLQEVPA
jgi:hypothetical protein